MSRYPSIKKISSNKKISSPSPILSFVLGLLILEVSFVSAAEGPSRKAETPISITSEKMVLKNLEDKIIFEGAVLIKQEGITIHSDRAEVFLSKSGQSSSSIAGEDEGREVTRIIVSGNVRILRGGQHAKANKGVYWRKEEVIILTGSPEVWDDDFHVKGKEITFFIQEERTKVSESQAVIFNGAKGLSSAKKLN